MSLPFFVAAIICAPAKLPRSASSHFLYVYCEISNENKKSEAMDIVVCNASFVFEWFYFGVDKINSVEYNYKSLNIKRVLPIRF